MKRGFTEGYKTYDTSEGFGSSTKWKRAFHQRFSQEEAKEILSDGDPYSILGIPYGSSPEEIKKAFRAKMMVWHPDKNPTNIIEATEMSKKIIAAYSLLT